MIEHSLDCAALLICTVETLLGGIQVQTGDGDIHTLLVQLQAWKL